MSVGIEQHVIDKVETPILEPAKTIGDCFRHRKEAGLDVALGALRNGNTAPESTTGRNRRYAKDLRIWSVLKSYLDATVAYEQQKCSAIVHDRLKTVTVPVRRSDRR